MLTISRPKVLPNKYFTLHSAENTIYALRPNEESKTSVVGFRNYKDAFLLAKMIETHYIQTNEWPDNDVDFVLPKPTVEHISHIFIEEWEIENILDIISVNKIIEDSSGYRFRAEMYALEGDVDFYKSRFEEFME